MTASASGYSALAARYDRLEHDNRILARGRRQSLDALSRTMPAGEPLLELGCGTGTEAMWVSKHLGCAVEAWDPSPEMVERARTKASEQGADVAVRHGTAEEALTVLGGEGHRFAGAWASFSLAYGPPLHRLRPLLHSVLLEGAAFVCSVPNRYPLASPWRLPSRARGSFLHSVGPARPRLWATTPGRAARDLRPGFQAVRWEAMNLLVPPSPLWPIWKRLGPLGRGVEALDTWLQAVRPFRSLGDHVLLVFRRSGPGSPP